ncbi:hypothetical protein BDY21DRAFT_388461 [Lineolata rhizophorae]|uniref:Short chain dehydrogenase n=1 Tax=Lineolata rhizophorae TaxID=578093 RepID=A0A6A6NM39_9PEZI|nr:hypothetical protein BDY21DRAFT_388461 [Lineolata rhizophorae]
MPSYLITGTSRGIGLEFVRQLSADPANTVIGLVRDKQATEQRMKEWKRDNIFTIQINDMADYASLKNAVEEASKITGGSLDYAIANAAYVSKLTNYFTFGDLPELIQKDMVDAFLVNVVGVVHFFNLTVPLLKKGTAKKAIALSTGLADDNMNVNFELDVSSPYSVSKAAMNMVVAKFAAEYKREGILFMAVAPGLVDTGAGDMHPNASELEKKRFNETYAKFMAYKNTPPITAEESVKAMLGVFESSKTGTDRDGAFISHLGNKQWI